MGANGEGQDVLLDHRFFHPVCKDQNELFATLANLNFPAINMSYIKQQCLALFFIKINHFVSPVMDRPPI